MQSSSYTVDGHTQADGRRYVIEKHIDAAGITHTQVYLAPATWTTTEMDARLAQNATVIDESLAANEAAKAIANDAMPALLYQTGEQLAERFWRHVRSVMVTDKVEYGRCIWWLYNRITAGQITSAQARNTFNSTFGYNLDQTAWGNLVNTKFIPAHDRYAGMISESEL